MKTYVRIVAGWLWLFALNGYGQHIFMPTARREKTVDSLRAVISRLSRQPVQFGRDTSLFYSLDRFYYHLSQLNPRYTPTVSLQRQYADSMYRLAARNHWQPGLAIAAVRQARAALNQRQDSATIRQLIQAVALCRRQNLPREQGMTLIHLASCFAYRPTNDLSEWQQAVRYMKQAQQIASRANDAEILFQYHNFMGDFHVIRGQYARALPYFESVQPLLDAHPELSGNRTNLAYRAICQLHLGHASQAKRLLHRFFAQSNPDEGTYATYLHHITLYEISQYYLRRQQYRTALRYLNQYASILAQRPPIDHFNYHRSMIEVHERLGDYRRALLHQRMHLAYRDTINSERLSQQFARMNLQYRLSRKENQLQALTNQALSQQNQAQQTRLWLLIALSGFSVALLGLLLYSNRLRNRTVKARFQLAQTRNESNARVMEAQEAERRRLAADLHDDIGTSLLALRGQLHANNPDAQHLLTQIITNVRVVSHNLLPVTLHDLGLAEALAEVAQRLEVASAIRFLFVQSGRSVSLGNVAELMVYRSVQELMHNVVRHSGATDSAVQLVWHDAHLNVTIEDNGRGMASSVGQGIGLTSVRSRIEGVGGTMAVDSSRSGTTIRLDIPFGHK